MRKKGNHSIYEVAFNKYLQDKKVTMIPTLEVKKAKGINGNPLKNFDNIILKDGVFLIDIKGKNFGFKSARNNLFENWILEEDPHALIEWEKIFKKYGVKVKSILVYMFKINFAGDEKYFSNIITYKSVKYGVVAITPKDYLKYSKQRSLKPKSLNISRKIFRDIALPLDSFIPSLEF